LGLTGPERVNLRVAVYCGILAAAALAVVMYTLVSDLHPPGELAPWTLPLLVAGMVVGEQLRVALRRGEHVATSTTLFESTLAPVLFFFAPWIAVAGVALAQVIGAALRRTTFTKGFFAVAQWALTTSVGALVLAAYTPEPRVDINALVGLVLALAVVAVLNNLATIVVMTIASQRSLPSVVASLRPIMLTGWVGSWIINLLIGLLFVLGADGHPVAVVLFPVPLLVLHYAYRGYAAARADRMRLSGLRRAATVLTEPLHPLNAIDDYLGEVATSFEAQAAGLVLLIEDSRYETHLVDQRHEDMVVQRREASPLEAALAMQADPVRVLGREESALAGLVSDEGWRDCTCAPLVDEQRQLGALIVFDQTGLASGSADVAVLDALARETAHTLARGRLLESVMEEQRKLDQIVSTTSDGIFTVGEEGEVLSWNAACERMTGLPAAEVNGRRDVMYRLSARTGAGAPVDFGDWRNEPELPRDVFVTTMDGADRRLSVAASEAHDADGRTRTLVVVARDVTPADEYEELRQQFSELAERQHAQRIVVDHLQQAVAPTAPKLEGTDMAVTYVASDPSSPTGGDLYDWHLLPNGELHVAVVDVLGHGVAATKDALTVIHTLRLVALEGTPLVDVVERADELLSAQESDLVATVVVARYHPVTGALRVVSGGHPPALVVGADGTVTQLAGTGGAIGWPGVGSDNVITTHLGVHESLVLYTDGLIEARKDILEGMDALVRHASDVSQLPAAQFADQLVDRALAGADRRDDTLALVLRRTRVTVHPDTLRLRVEPGDRAGIRAARRGLHEWLHGQGADSDDPVLVAAELLANAAVAARFGAVLTAAMDGDHVVLEVSDDGPGTDMEGRGRLLPHQDSEGGRGLFLVRALSDDVTTLSIDGGTVVRCRVRVRATTPSREVRAGG
jgi:PAS domain S-box-containing protein